MQTGLLQFQRPEMNLEMVPRNDKSVRILLSCGRIKSEATEMAAKAFVYTITIIVIIKSGLIYKRITTE